MAKYRYICEEDRTFHTLGLLTFGDIVEFAEVGAGDPLPPGLVPGWFEEYVESDEE